MAMDIEKLSVAELVAFAESKGLRKEIRGMTEKQVRSLLKKDNIADSFEPKRFKSLSWLDIKKLAKTKGINTFKKKRSEIEILLEKASCPETDEVVEKTDTPKEVFKEIPVEIPPDVLVMNRQVGSNTERIWELEQRLDRIVMAILPQSQNKSIKDL